MRSYPQTVELEKKGIPNSYKSTRTNTLTAKETSQHQTANPVSKEVPIFRTPSDSVQFQLIEKELSKKMIKAQYLDSLNELLERIYSRGIIGFRKVYSANKSFFSYDSLALAKDYSAITHLSIANRKSRAVPADILRCKNLVELELVNTSISRIQRKLNNLERLKTVYVLNNQTKHSLKLNRNVRIKTLLFRGNRPSNLPRNYSQFKALTTLDLDQNSLAMFPRGLKKNTQLKNLILTNNALTLKEKSLPVYPFVEKLDLSKNEIEIVPAAIGGFVGLKQLKCSFNKITSIPNEISELKNVEQLSFYCNKLSALPHGLFRLPSLREIDLYYNQLERIDADEMNWQKLEVLYLAFNKLYSLPKNLDKMHTLKELYLHNNRLSEIPINVGKLKNLKVLRVNNNLLTQLDTNLSNLESLENLDVSNNSIVTTRENFLRFRSLKILSLVGNPWDIDTKANLSTIAIQLRQRNTIVYLNSFGEEQN